MSWKKIENVEEEQVEETMIVFDVNSFKFYEFNETMTFIWSKLSDSVDETDLVKSLSSEFDVDENTARADVQEMIKDLEEKKLIKRV